MFEYSLSHYTRLLQEIRALQDAGAEVQLLTAHPVADNAPPGVTITASPLGANGSATYTVPASRLPWRPLRIADNLARNVLRPLVRRASPVLGDAVRVRNLRRLLPTLDLFWVIDYPSLPTVIRAVAGSSVKVVYETVDLVPEYQYRGQGHRARSLDGERRIIGTVDGFITACDSYADYYMERYGALLQRPPCVRDNMPDVRVEKPGPTTRPLKLLFLGSLMFDRPVFELIEAIASTQADVTLTFQGKNYLGERVAARIAELNLQPRVRVVEPCPAEMIVQTASAYDVGIVALRGDNENERRASTSKLFTYMAAGLGILGSDLPGIALVVRNHRNGMLVEGTGAQEWAKAMESLASRQDADIDDMRCRSLEAAEEYSWDRQRPRFIDEFRRALARG